MTASTPLRSIHRLLPFALAVALLALPASTAAFTIESITVSRSPTKGDAFKIKAALDASEALPLATAVGVAFDLDGTIAGLPTATMKRTRTKLAFKGVRGAPGVAQLTLDLKKRRLTAKGAFAFLPNVPSPLVVRLEADGVEACAVVRLERLGKPPRKPPTKPKTVRYGLPKNQHGEPCLLTGRLHGQPESVVVDVATSVRFEAVLTSTAGNAQVRRLDGAGVPTGPAACALVDDGSPASGDLVAGDGLFACTTTIEEHALATLGFAVEATVGGTTRVSPPLRLSVVAPRTDADVNAMFDAQDQARSIWDALVATLGDTLNARQEAIKQIAALPGVAEAGLSPNGFDIFMRYTSGYSGGLMLSGRLGDPDDLPPLAALARTPPPELTETPPVQPRAILRCSDDTERTLIGNRKALILKTSYFGSGDDAPIAAAAFRGSCLPILPIDVVTQDLTMAALLGIAPYSAVFLSTHGYVDGNGEILILTEQTATRAEVLAAGPVVDPFDAREAFVVGLPKIRGGDRNVWVVRPAFLRRIPGQIDAGFVYASHCHGDEDPAEAAVFRFKGAKAFFGFDGVVSLNFARISTATVIPVLAQQLLTTGDAYTRAVKIDPTPFFGNPLEGKALTRVLPKLASFHLRGDEHLAYVGEPTVTPDSSKIAVGDSVELTVEVPQKNDCELVHRWTTTREAGELHDAKGHSGAEFDTTESHATYQSFGDRVGIDDQVISVRAPTPSGGAEPPFFGEACATVEVSGCGDGILQSGEECDGPADAACPGACLLDCTCRRGPVCGNDVKEPGEICDGTDRAACDAISPSGVGYCDPDCTGCAVCGDGEVTPNEQCDPLDDSPCPNACRINCTCGCAPGDPTGCPADKCCNPSTKDCCAPRRNSFDPTCFLTASGCCGGGNLQPNLCGMGGPSPSVCPSTADCSTSDFYYCLYCDNKLVQGFCNANAPCGGP